MLLIGSENAKISRLVLRKCWRTIDQSLCSGSPPLLWGPESSLDPSTHTCSFRLFSHRVEQVNDEVANVLVAQLLYLANDDPDKDITLYINSPGGSVSAGMAIYDAMQVRVGLRVHKTSATPPREHNLGAVVSYLDRRSCSSMFSEVSPRHSCDQSPFFLLTASHHPTERRAP